MVSVQCMYHYRSNVVVSLWFTVARGGGIGSMAVDLTRSTCSVSELPDMQDIWAYVCTHIDRQSM